MFLRVDFLHTWTCLCYLLIIDNGTYCHAIQALRNASKGGHLEVVTKLLEAGANVHAENDEVSRIDGLR